MTTTESYLVTVSYNRTTKRTIERWEDPKVPGIVHRANGPAVIERNSFTGAILYEAWYRRGRLRRDNGPSEIWRNEESGQIEQEGWGNGRFRKLLPQPPRTRLDDRLAAPPLPAPHL